MSAWGSNLNFNSSIYAIAITDVWIGVFSWWSKTFFFAKLRLFFHFHWLFLLFEDNQWKSSHVHPKKLMPWPCQQMKLSSPFFKLTLPFRSIVLAVLSSLVQSNGHMLQPWLWIDVKNRLYCCETLTNTRLKHLHDAVFVVPGVLVEICRFYS